MKKNQQGLKKTLKTNNLLSNTAAFNPRLNTDQQANLKQLMSNKSEIPLFAKINPPQRKKRFVNTRKLRSVHKIQTREIDENII